MKKYNVLKKLSLFHQLFALLIIVGLLIVMVMMPLVDFNLKSIIDNQMYETLSNEQEMIINNTTFVPRGEKKYTIHIIYDSTINRAISTNLIKQEELNVYYRYVFSSPLEKLIN